MVHKYKNVNSLLMYEFLTVYCIGARDNNLMNTKAILRMAKPLFVVISHILLLFSFGDTGVYIFKLYFPTFQHLQHFTTV
jgi:hypothetical protein